MFVDVVTICIADPVLVILGGIFEPQYLPNTGPSSVSPS